MRPEGEAGVRLYRDLQAMEKRLDFILHVTGRLWRVLGRRGSVLCFKRCFLGAKGRITHRGMEAGSPVRRQGAR